MSCVGYVYMLHRGNTGQELPIYYLRIYQHSWQWRHKQNLVDIPVETKSRRNLSPRVVGKSKF